ncbi:hypothetical protein pb186bvf_020817 [Paramecium bursaria]
MFINKFSQICIQYQFLKHNRRSSGIQYLISLNQGDQNNKPQKFYVEQQNLRYNHKRK